MDMHFTTKTLPSKKKPFKRTNEDAFIAESYADDHVFVVADGNDLSHIYLSTLPDVNISSAACRYFVHAFKHSGQLSVNLEDRVLTALTQTIEEVCRNIEDNNLLQHQATTMTALVLSGNEYVAAHVGDSALLHYSKQAGQIQSVSIPSLSGDTALFIQPSSKSMLLESIRPFSNALRRHLYRGTVGKGDFFLLTTDGLLHLWNKISGNDGLPSILSVLIQQGKGPEEISNNLFEAASRASSHDDLTSVIVHISG